MVSATHALMQCGAVLLFANFNKMFFGYIDPEMFFFNIMKINDVWGDLTDISAIKEALVRCSEDFFKSKSTYFWILRSDKYIY